MAKQHRCLICRPELLHERVFHSRKEIARELGVSIPCVNYIIATGDLHSQQIGGKTVVTHGELLRFSRQFRIEHLASIKSTRNVGAYGAK